jgi:hypothetical protein
MKAKIRQGAVDGRERTFRKFRSRGSAPKVETIVSGVVEKF